MLIHVTGSMLIHVTCITWATYLYVYIYTYSVYIINIWCIYNIHIQWYNRLIHVTWHMSIHVTWILEWIVSLSSELHHNICHNIYLIRIPHLHMLIHVTGCMLIHITGHVLIHVTCITWENCIIVYIVRFAQGIHVTCINICHVTCVNIQSDTSYPRYILWHIW